MGPRVSLTSSLTVIGEKTSTCPVHWRPLTTSGSLSTWPCYICPCQAIGKGVDFLCVLSPESRPWLEPRDLYKMIYVSLKKMLHLSKALLLYQMRVIITVPPLQGGCKSRVIFRELNSDYHIGHRRPSINSNYWHPATLLRETFAVLSGFCVFWSLFFGLFPSYY
jgi:hypothetical protein